jgi:hypothetical protein
VKKCITCGEGKELSEFYKHSAMADGHLNKCIGCCRAYARQRRLEKPERVRSIDRNRSRKPARRSDAIVKQRDQRRRNPEKERARRAVSYAVKVGKLVRPEKCACGSDDRIEAHHEDYSRPLDVEWLCFRCHRTDHGQFQEKP